MKQNVEKNIPGISDPALVDTKCVNSSSVAMDGAMVEQLLRQSVRNVWAVLLTK